VKIQQLLQSGLTGGKPIFCMGKTALLQPSGIASADILSIALLQPIKKAKKMNRKVLIITLQQSLQYASCL